MSIYITDDQKVIFKPTGHSNIEVETINADKLGSMIHGKKTYFASTSVDSRMNFSKIFTGNNIYYVDSNESPKSYQLKYDDLLIIMVDIQNFIVIQKIL